MRVADVIDHKQQTIKLNQQLLDEARKRKGYKSTEWASWAQWQTQGRIVRHGEKGSMVYGFSGKHFYVFNLEQTDEL